jgi:hypothetical protein
MSVLREAVTIRWMMRPGLRYLHWNTEERTPSALPLPRKNLLPQTLPFVPQQKVMYASPDVGCTTSAFSGAFIVCWHQNIPLRQMFSTTAETVTINELVHDLTFTWGGPCFFTRNAGPPLQHSASPRLGSFSILPDLSWLCLAIIRPAPLASCSVSSRRRELYLSTAALLYLGFRFMLLLVVRGLG